MDFKKAKSFLAKWFKRVFLAAVVGFLVGIVAIAIYQRNFEIKPEPETKVKKVVEEKTNTILGYSKDMRVSCYTLVETPSDGKFANGEWADEDKNVVASNDLAFGTEVKIEGFEEKFVVKDRMQAGWQHADIDIYFGEDLEDYKKCKEFGKPTKEVLIYQDKPDSFFK